eukprot:TRINITY_DN63154_c0_g1_i1.p1 TRINITY_DN63154_c0_g1~~TRINITY_DN63154_c0_g1_i1.p1  ORF type:complete len:470 (+),score=81.91 TRINITY_DN63154_c0_g1_i1:91-1500(+)
MSLRLEQHCGRRVRARLEDPLRRTGVGDSQTDFVRKDGDAATATVVFSSIVNTDASALASFRSPSRRPLRGMLLTGGALPVDCCSVLRSFLLAVEIARLASTCAITALTSNTFVMDRGGSTEAWASSSSFLPCSRDGWLELPHLRPKSRSTVVAMTKARVLWYQVETLHLPIDSFREIALLGSLTRLRCLTAHGGQRERMRDQDEQTGARLKVDIGEGDQRFDLMARSAMRVCDSRCPVAVALCVAAQLPALSRLSLHFPLDHFAGALSREDAIQPLVHIARSLEFLSLTAALIVTEAGVCSLVQDVLSLVSGEDAFRFQTLKRLQLGEVWYGHAFSEVPSGFSRFTRLLEACPQLEVLVLGGRGIVADGGEFSAGYDDGSRSRRSRVNSRRRQRFDFGTAILADNLEKELAAPVRAGRAPRLRQVHLPRFASSEEEAIRLQGMASKLAEIGVALSIDSRPSRSSQEQS